MRSWKILHSINTAQQLLKHCCVIKIILTLNPKHNNISITKKKINFIPAKTRTSVYRYIPTINQDNTVRQISVDNALMPEGLRKTQFWGWKLSTSDGGRSWGHRDHGRIGTLWYSSVTCCKSKDKFSSLLEEGWWKKLILETVYEIQSIYSYVTATVKKTHCMGHVIMVTVIYGLSGDKLKI